MRCVVLALVGFSIAGQAHAQERWPQKVCDDLAREEATLEKQHAIFFASEDKVSAAETLATTRIHVLLLQKKYCGVDVRAKFAVDNAASDAAQRRREAEYARAKADVARIRTRRQPSRPSLNCATIATEGGTSFTTCD
jgi:hypothetical protein